jgi:trk system potassium uptake protein TrkA
MSRQIVIVGGGRVGRRVAEQLSEDRNTVTMIELRPENCDQVSPKVTNVVQGDGADPSMLERIDLTETDIFAALTDDTAVNLAACELVYDNAPEVRTILRISHDGEQDYGHRRFVDSVVYPAAAGADAAVERIAAV